MRVFLAQLARFFLGVNIEIGFSDSSIGCHAVTLAKGGIDGRERAIGIFDPGDIRQAVEQRALRSDQGDVPVVTAGDCRAARSLPMMRFGIRKASVEQYCGIRDSRKISVSILIPVFRAERRK